MSFIFRAYHAMARQRPMSTKTGLPTAAIYVFVNMLRKLREDFSPEYLAAVFDVAGPTFRDEQAEAVTTIRKFDIKTQTFHGSGIQRLQGQPRGHAGRPGAAGSLHPARARGLPDSDSGGECASRPTT